MLRKTTKTARTLKLAAAMLTIVLGAVCLQVHQVARNSRIQREAAVLTCLRLKSNALRQEVFYYLDDAERCLTELVALRLEAHIGMAMVMNEFHQPILSLTEQRTETLKAQAEKSQRVGKERLDVLLAVDRAIVERSNEIARLLGEHDQIVDVGSPSESGR